MTNDKILRAKRINGELDKVKRALLVHFGEYSVLPDIVLYQASKDNVKILAILSVKNSFRELQMEIKASAIAHNFSH